MFVSRKVLLGVVGVVGGLGMLQASVVQGSVVQHWTGMSSVNNAIVVESNLTISGDTLTIVLSNLSTQSLAPNDLLASYYFDIVNGASQRPALNYESAVGDVYLADKNAPDGLAKDNANLVAVNSKPADRTWQFKTLNLGLYPFLGFGLGTVGNGNFPAANAFNGNIVDGMDYSIYAGDVTTENLDGKYLVKGPITFTFSGVTGFSEADIAMQGAFGFGTAPDSVEFTVVPEPTSLGVMVLSAVICMGRRKARI